MATMQLVNIDELENNLTSIANTIREKTQNENTLSFPNGFNNEINNNLFSLEDISEGKNYPSEINFKGTFIRPFLFANNKILEKFIGENVTSVSANKIALSSPLGYQFSNCSNLKQVILPMITNYGECDFIFLNCTSLENIDLLKVNSVTTSQFQGCSKLKGLVLPNFKNTIWSNFINGCSSLTYLDLGSSSIVFPSSGKLAASSVSNATKFNILILRYTNIVVPLVNINAFSGTPFASGKSGGTLYVSQNLITSYQEATNWSTILSYPNNQILPIEESMYQTQYGDGTPITI